MSTHISLDATTSPLDAACDHTLRSLLDCITDRPDPGKAELLRSLLDNPTAHTEAILGEYGYERETRSVTAGAFFEDPDQVLDLSTRLHIVVELLDNAAGSNVLMPSVVTEALDQIADHVVDVNNALLTGDAASELQATVDGWKPVGFHATIPVEQLTTNGIDSIHAPVVA